MYDGKRWAISVYLLQVPEMKYVQIEFLNYVILSISTLRSSLSLLICEYGNSFLNQCIASSVKKCLFYACYVPTVWLPWNCWFHKVLSTIVHQTLEIKYLTVHSHVYFAIICHYPFILPLSLSLFLAHGLRNGQISVFILRKS